MSAITTYPPGSLEAECPGGLDWAWYGLGECIQSLRDKVSIAFGVMSIICWVIFGIPQIVENCRKKIPDAAVSVFLLLFWIFGDSLNFIGTFLTNQLFLQKLLAGYTVCIDLVLFGQYLFYKHKHQKHREEIIEAMDSDEKAASDDKSSSNGKAFMAVLLGITGVRYLSLDGGKPPAVMSASSYGVRQLLQATEAPGPFDNFLPTIGEKIGYAFGWISFFMYASGRIHQIFLNWRRKTTEGLSIYLFVLAVLGNTFYACQIFVRSINAVFVVTSLPWILGSLGMLVFDFIIFGQFFHYRHNKPNIAENEDKWDEEASL